MYPLMELEEKYSGHAHTITQKMIHKQNKHIRKYKDEKLKWRKTTEEAGRFWQSSLTDIVPAILGVSV